MKIFVFGSSLTSSYWNGAATYYRGIYKYLHRLGYQITFAEPDIYKRQQNRDDVLIDYAGVIVYQTPQDIDALLAQAAEADLVVKHSGVGAADEFLEAQILDCKSDRTRVAFWDVDAPATLARVEENRSDPFRDLIPEYDFILTYGGGMPIIDHYKKLGAANCHPIYNGLDADHHHPVTPDPKYVCDLAFIGNRLPDREKRVEQFFLRAAELAPDLTFILGGEGWGSKEVPENVQWIGHVATSQHNVINSSARMLLNLNRDSMADVGFSPPTRVFEAAGAGGCLITDNWAGIDEFFEPQKEILIASTAEGIVDHLRNRSVEECRAIGTAMKSRALHQHTYELRVKTVDSILKSHKKETHQRAERERAVLA
jgi:spore maturation protein CgeB